MFRAWLCCILPWHKWVSCEPVSSISDKLTCSCGQAYGMNNIEQIMLPWRDVEPFYRAKAVRPAVGSSRERDNG
jgi:hypothetical protein